VPDERRRAAQRASICATSASLSSSCTDARQKPQLRSETMRQAASDAPCCGQPPRAS
jgi:hypothetical protein